MKIYTGVGSRSAPEHILKTMRELGECLARKGWVLRSGAAEGSDTAFEEGCDAGSGSKKIYIPWNGFNDRWSDGASVLTLEQGDRDKALDIIKEVHPAFDKLSLGAKKLHARNAYQVLGIYLDTPSKFLICYAQVDAQGVPKGGTRTSWVLAQMFDIPCFNLGNDRDYERVTKLLEGSNEDL